MLPKSKDWEMHVHNGLIPPDQSGTTLKSYTSSYGRPEVDQGCHCVWFNFFLCLTLLPSPPFHRCWQLNQHSVWKTPSQSLLSGAPNLQQSHFSPSTAMTLSEAPKITNVMATFSAGLASLLLFSSPLGQGQGEEKTPKGVVWRLYSGLQNTFWCTQRVKGFLWSVQEAVPCLFWTSSLSAPSPSASHSNPQQVRKSCRLFIKIYFELTYSSLSPIQSHKHLLLDYRHLASFHSLSTLVKIIFE